MKRIVSFLLALVLTLSLTTNALAAVVSPKADVTEITVDQTVDLTVTASGEDQLTGVVCLNYRVYFDPTFFELDAAASKAKTEGAKLTALRTDEDGKSYYAVSLLDTASAGLTVSGDLYTLAFKVKAGAKLGDESKFTVVKAHVYTIADNELKAVDNGAVENAEVTVKIVASTPADVTLKEAKAALDGITVTWEAADNAESYNVLRRTADTEWKVLAENVTGVTYKDETAQAGTEYFYTVQGVAADGKTVSKGYDDNGVSATALYPIPADVELTDAVVNGNTIVVTWQAASGASSYNVYRKGPGDANWKVVSAKQSGTSYIDKNVAMGSTYTYTVRGLAADGTTISKGFDAAGVSATMPVVPARVTMTAAKVSGNTIVVTWEKAANAATYNVYRMGPSDTNWRLVSAKQSGTSYTDKNAAGGVTYTYTVRGVAADGKTLSPSYDAAGKSDAVTKAPTTPANVTMGKSTAVKGSITVTWSYAADAKTYNVYRKGPGDTNWKVVSAKQSGTSYTDKNVTAGSTYTYTVRGVSADGKTLSRSFDAGRSAVAK